MTATKTLFELTAGELMSGVAVALREQMPLRRAADELFRAGVHGAPVVDAAGRCVGVLSVYDLARWAVRHEHPLAPAPRPCPDTMSESVCLEWQMVEMEALPTEDVGRYMSPDPVTVRPEASIREIARRMLDAGVRRVIVTDPGGVPVGVVSTTDLVAAIASFDED